MVIFSHLSLTQNRRTIWNGSSFKTREKSGRSPAHKAHVSN